MPAEFRPEALLRVLAKHRVDCIVIGGSAAYMQGSPVPTEDIDIVPNPARDNMARLSAALKELKAHVRAGDDAVPFDHDADSLLASKIWNLTTKYGDLDITHEPTGTQGYADLRRDAITIQLKAGEIRLASLADIIRSKEAAGRDKDRRSLPVLRELLSREIRERTGRRAR